MNNFKQTLYLSAYTYVVGLAYLLIIQLNVVDTGLVKWDSDVGHLLIIPSVVCSVYATFMVLYALITRSTVITHINSGLYYMDKHESIARVMEKQ